MSNVFVSLVLAMTMATSHVTPKQYAHHLAIQRGWVGAEWQALNVIVKDESGWRPCAVNPQRRLCHYGSLQNHESSCGIPQAQPCPRAWWGRLWKTRYAQVRWLFNYIKRRYGDPLTALAFRRAHNWY